MKSVLISILTICLMAACSQKESHIVVTVGTGEMKVQPNQATLLIDLKSKEQTMTLAKQNNANLTQKIKTLMIEKLKLPKENLSTSSYNLGRNYRRDRSYNQIPDGFFAQHSLALKILDFKRVGEIIDTLGVFSDISIGNPQFSHSEMEKFQTQVLKEAVANARIKADIMAKESGRTLGRVIQVREGTDTHSYLKMSKRAQFDQEQALSASTEIKPSQLSVSQSVTVTFELN